MDTCRATGAPEAAANLLLHPHRFVSSKILRIDTRYYLEEERDGGSDVLNGLLYNSTKRIENLNIPRPDKLQGNKTVACKIVSSYLSRPDLVFDHPSNSFVETKNMDMVEFVENLKCTKKIKEHHNTSQ